MKTLTSIQENPKHYAVVNVDGIVQGVVLANSDLSSKFITCISDSYGEENVEIVLGYEVGPFDYNFSVTVSITQDGGDPYTETFDFQMVEIY